MQRAAPIVEAGNHACEIGELFLRVPNAQNHVHRFVCVALDVGALLQEMCVALKDTMLAAARRSGWNGSFSTFEARSFKTQVVAGTNFFVKVAVAPDTCVHARVFKPLPHTGGAPTLAGVKLAKLETPIEYF